MKRGVVTILCVLFLLGCTSGGSTNQPRENWRTGNEGLYVNWLPNLPPPRIYDDQPVEAVIDIENHGAAPVGGPGDKIYLSGFDPNIITGITTSGATIPQMEGKNEFGPGGIGTVSFKGVIRALGFRNVEKYTPRMLLTSCYGYETIGADNVCIDPDPYASSNAPKVCTPSSVSMGGSQGAPITLGPIEVEPSPGRTRFKITVTNSGRGDVFKPGTQQLDKCSPYSDSGFDYADLDTVQITDVSVSGVSILPSCRPSTNGFLRLQNGRGQIYCELTNIPGNTAYTTTITVKAIYGYRETQTRDLTILKVS